MESAKQLASRVREVLLDGKWIAGTNYQEKLLPIDWEQASYKIESLNTIAALSFHINYYLEGILQVFNGGSLDIRDKYSFDHTHINDAESWEKLKVALFRNSEEFVKNVANFSEEELEADFTKKEYGSYRRNIEGVIEHSYYHFGQISLISKLVKEQLDHGN